MFHSLDVLKEGQFWRHNIKQPFFSGCQCLHSVKLPELISHDPFPNISTSNKREFVVRCATEAAHCFQTKKSFRVDFANLHFG
jgi:hypothetical protein